MRYKILNTLIPVPDSHRLPLLATLVLYDKGGDLTNSPLIRSRVNLTHKDVYFSENKEVALLKRQKALIALYENIKTNGYNGSIILAWFDNDGIFHLYDGYHRLAIMEHLGLNVEVSVEVNWQGIDGSVGKDFPLSETLINEEPRGKWLYQPIFDDRVKGWKLARNDTPQRFDYILKNLVGKTVLDIGCSEGYFSRELAKRGYLVTGIDKSKGLIASSRYLSIINNLSINYHHVNDWKDFLDKNGPYDNILFLSVIHNDMKIIGVEEGLRKLESFRGKAKRIFFEVPNNTNEKQWMVNGFPKFDFHSNNKILQECFGMSIKDKWSGLRSIFLMGENGRKQIPIMEIPGLILENNVNGYPMYLFKDEKYITPIILNNHKYEPKMTDLIKRWLRPGQTFVDAGANIGYFTILASKIVGDNGRVYAFEPSSKNFEVLMANIALNNCSNVTAINKALTDKAGKSRLYRMDETSHGQLYLQEALIGDKQLAYQGYSPKDVLEKNDYEEVETVRLDDILTKPPEMIKMDVESSELVVIKGMEKLLNLPSDITILIEDLTDEGVKYLCDNFGFTITERLFERWNHMLRRSNIDINKWVKSRGTHYKSLFQELSSKENYNIMEIGTWDGSNAIRMIKAASLRVPEDEISYYGFDLFEESNSELIAEEFSPTKIKTNVEAKETIEKWTKAKVVLFKGNTKETLPSVIKTLPLMDLIYIDGGHSIETVRNDWNYSSQLMKGDTTILFDDYCDEMPFIGPKFLVGEFKNSKYSTEILPEVDYYPRAFGRFKSQLLKVKLKANVAKTTLSKPSILRLHILGVAHSATNKEYSLCPFSQLTLNMCKMMHGLGYEVYHYGTEGGNPDCSENITVVTKDDQKKAYGDFDWRHKYWQYSRNDYAYRTFTKNAIDEIGKRKQPEDLLLISGGRNQKEIADALNMTTIEFAIGYEGIFSNYKVFASYAWMHYLYGLLNRNVDGKVLQNGACNGNWYDVVIPHYFDPDDFEYSSYKKDYFLFVGRLIPRKGAHIAVQVCERTGNKLIIAGQELLGNDYREKYLNKPFVEYVGTVSLEEKSKLMREAKGVFIPTIYLEPFGMVVVEALLSGTPVITTDWGAFPEIVKHGEVGFRCRTMDDFIWAVNNIDKISPGKCREYSVNNYSINRIAKMYQEYFLKIKDLFSIDGWYMKHKEREELDWLRRY